MAKTQTTSQLEEGAPIPKNAIDPDLVKLGRGKGKIGLITALGVVGLCVYFLLKLSPDRHFAGAGEEPVPVAVADVLEGRVAMDDHVVLEAQPAIAHALRAFKAKGDLGYRFVPARDTNDRLWLALPGDDWGEPTADAHYQGRIRTLDALSFAAAVRDYAAANPRPVFATLAELRAGAASGNVKTVAGESIAVAAGDRVAYDLVEPNAATIIASINENHPTKQAWLAACAQAGLEGVTPATPKEIDEALGQVRFDVKLSPADATKKLADAKLFATRVEPVTRHIETTWADAKAKLPDTVDLVGLYSKRGIPDDAYVLIANENPKDYWYVTPITVILVVIGLVFAWALVRAVRRDLLPAR